MLNKKLKRSINYIDLIMILFDYSDTGNPYLAYFNYNILNRNKNSNNLKENNLIIFNIEI